MTQDYSIWAVEASDGMYDDCRDWTVALYTQHEHAVQHVERLRAWWAVHLQEFRDREWSEHPLQCPYDPTTQTIYGGGEHLKYWIHHAIVRTASPDTYHA